MANVGSVVVNIVAKTAAFTKGMKNARTSLRRFDKRVTESITRIAKWGAAIAVAGAAIGVALVRRSMTAIDAVAKLAARLDVTTEFLQGMKVAASITGGSVEGMAKSLTNLTRRIGEAQQGTGEGVATLKLLGLEADALAKAGPEEAFKQVAEAINNLPGATQKAAAAFQLFGRQGATMLNLFKEGRKGIDDFIAEAKRLGFAFDAVDAARVEAANDAFARMGLLLEGVFQRIAIEVAPFIEALAKGFTKAATAGGDFGKTTTSVIRTAILGLARLADFFMPIKLAIKAVQIAWEGFKFIVLTGVADILTDINHIIDGINKIPGIDIDKINLVDLGKEIQKSVDAVDSLTTEMGDILAGKTNVERATAFFEDLDAAASKARTTIAKASEERRNRDAEALAMQKELLATEKKLAKLKPFAARVVEDLKTPIEQFKAFRAQLEELTRTIDPATGKALLSQADFEKALQKRLKELQVDIKVKPATAGAREQADFATVGARRLDVAGLARRPVADVANRQREEQIRLAREGNAKLAEIARKDTVQ